MKKNTIIKLTRQFDDPVMEQLYNNIDQDFKSMMDKMIKDILESFKYEDSIEKSGMLPGGIRAQHKYTKRTGAPGHYTYWYSDPAGKLHEGPKPSAQQESELASDTARRQLKNEKVLITVRNKPIEPSYAEKMEPKIKEPSYMQEKPTRESVINKIKEEGQKDPKKYKEAFNQIINKLQESGMSKEDAFKILTPIKEEVLGNKPTPIVVKPLQKSSVQRGGMKTQHKYIKRTGGPGNYHYWYQDEHGKLYEGKNAPKGHEDYNGDKPKKEIKKIPLQVQRSIDVRKKIKKRAALPMDTQAGLNLMKKYKLNIHQDRENFYNALKDNVQSDEHIKKICFARIHLYHNINLEGNWGKNMIDVVQNFELVSNMLPIGHIAHNQHFKSLQNHVYEAPVEGKDIEVKNTYASYAEDTIHLSDQAVNKGDVGGNIAIKREFIKVVAHEIGHAVSIRLREKNQAGYDHLASLAGWSKEAAEKIATGDTGERSIPIPQDIKKVDLISSYATKCAEENFAELYSTYLLNHKAVNEALAIPTKFLLPNEPGIATITDRRGKKIEINKDILEQFRALRKYVFDNTAMKKAFKYFIGII